MPAESPCDSIRQHFSPFLDGELDSETRAAVENHLAECPQCLSEFHDFQQVTVWFQDQARLTAPPDFEEQLHRRLHPQTIRLRTARHAPRPWWPLAAAAAFLACSALVLIPRMRTPQTFDLAKSDGPAQQSLGIPARETASPPPALSAPSGPAGEIQQDLVDEETAHPLNALGYVQNESRGVPPQDAPREKIALPGADMAAPPPAPAEETMSEAIMHIPAPMASESAKQQEPAPGGATLPTPEPMPAPVPTPAPAPEPPSALEPARESALPSELSSGSSAEGGIESEEAPLPVLAAAQPTSKDESSYRNAPAERGPGKTAKTMRGKTDNAGGEAPAKAVMDGRRFLRENGLWREESYAGQKTLVLYRDSPRFETLRQTSPDLEKIADLGSEVIFCLNDLWYHLKPAPKQP